MYTLRLEKDLLRYRRTFIFMFDQAGIDWVNFPRHPQTGVSSRYPLSRSDRWIEEQKRCFTAYANMKNKNKSWVHVHNCSKVSILDNKKPFLTLLRYPLATSNTSQSHQHPNKKATLIFRPLCLLRRNLKWHLPQRFYKARRKGHGSSEGTIIQKDKMSVLCHFGWKLFFSNTNYSKMQSLERVIEFAVTNVIGFIIDSCNSRISAMCKQWLIKDIFSEKWVCLARESEGNSQIYSQTH